jgi:Putative glucoamylase
VRYGTRAGIVVAAVFVGAVVLAGSSHPAGAAPGQFFPKLVRATYASISAMTEPSTGLPQDRFDRSIYDIFPQFALARHLPAISTGPGASLDASRCTDATCRSSGFYGLRLVYSTPSATFASYSLDSYGFDATKATYLELWVKGAAGGEAFEVVLWSMCGGGFPGRPSSGLVTATASWRRVRIPLTDYGPYVDLSSLCRLSIGFNDAISPGGTVYLDRVAFARADGTRIAMPLDEPTSTTNIGLYMTDVAAAVDLGLESRTSAVAKLAKTIDSVEQLPKWHGFPQTWNHVVSRTAFADDQCISSVDEANLAAGLVVLRRRFPVLAARATALLDAMDWSWFYDSSVGLLYGCRYPDGSASTWHYDFLAADSRLAYVIGIGTGELPVSAWSNLNRVTEAPRCAADSHFGPGWTGGGLFMQFLPGIFVPEAGTVLGDSARHFAADQICYAAQIHAPAWGWSATSLPPNGRDYCGYGCQHDEVLVPHASILAADDVTPVSLEQNLEALQAIGARPPVSDGASMRDFGFAASVNWQTHEVNTAYLVLDQSMAFLSLANRQNGKTRKAFAADPIGSTAISLIPDY